jgi:hypothetical protein
MRVLERRAKGMSNTCLKYLGGTGIEKLQSVQRERSSIVTFGGFGQKSLIVEYRLQTRLQHNGMKASSRDGIDEGNHHEITVLSPKLGPGREKTKSKTRANKLYQQTDNGTPSTIQNMSTSRKGRSGDLLGRLQLGAKTGELCFA